MGYSLIYSITVQKKFNKEKFALFGAFSSRGEPSQPYAARLRSGNYEAWASGSNYRGK